MTLRRLQLDTSWGQLTVVGGSRAGEGTVVVLPQLRLALDAGRPLRALTPMTTLVLSHGHMDHLGALGYWASQRFLQAMGPATVVLPRSIAADVAGLLEAMARLEGGAPYEIDLVPADDGSHHPLRRDLDLELFATDHWVPTIGTLVRWHTHKLRPDLVGEPSATIAARRAAGEEVSVRRTVPVLAYCADTGPGLWETRPDLLATEVVLLECSFFRDRDRERARRYGHLHLDDLCAVAPRLGCRHLVLLHASRRHRLRDAVGRLEARLAPLLPCPMHHLFVDWE
jgi:ribonuclease BN (tRNA processing enzyme)